RPDIIDPALLRPGRFDKSIYIGTPDSESRKKIFAIHTKNKPLADDVDLDKLASVSDGYTGADIAAVCNEAVMGAVRELVKSGTMPSDEEIDKCQVHMADFERAMDKLGPKVRANLKEYGKNNNN
ncbi:MAG: cell division protein FtsH, partial [Candidatus Methanomethylophilaceae archaeon]|nr:cell division protein FtsH [Candidatus Methanomethylophilaceae archaeon]